MAIVCVLNELVFSLFYKANVMQQCQWSYFKLGPSFVVFFLSTLTDVDLFRPYMLQMAN